MFNTTLQTESGTLGHQTQVSVTERIYGTASRYRLLNGNAMLLVSRLVTVLKNCVADWLLASWDNIVKVA
jgi:hypothetical protein